MRRPVGGDDPVFRQRLAAGVHEFLETGLRVLLDPTGVDRVQQRAEGPHHCALGGGVAPVEEDGADYGLDGIGEHRVRHRRDADAYGQAQGLRHLDERFLAHERGAQLGELAFGELREALVQLVRDGAAEHAVTQEFQPFVVCRAVAAMRQRLLGEARIGEGVTEQLY